MKCRKYCIVLMLSLYFNLSLVGQTCCSGGVPLSGNIGLPASTKGVWQFAFNYDLNTLNTLYSGTQNLEDNSRNRKTHSVLLEAGYSFGERISLDAFFSFVRQERLIEQFGNHNFSYTNGIGDAVFLIKYRITHPENQWHTLQIGLGPKAPLGSSNRRDKGGIIQDADLQPGSGSWDGVFWGNYRYQMASRKSMSFNLTGIFRLTGKNDDYLGSITYQFGNELQAILGVVDQFVVKSTLVNPSLSFRLRNVASDINNGTLAANTGGKWVFIIPGFTIQLLKSLAWNTQTELPLFSKVEGTQVTPTYRINTGIYLEIKGKRELSDKFKP